MKIKQYTSIFLALLLTSLPVSGVFAETGFDREAFYEATVREYQFAQLSDPDLISDAEFFGVWENGGWVREPYFAYDMFPGLSLVEEAAKKGDYDTCEQEILNYYREKYLDFGFGNGAPAEMTDKLYAQYESMMDNFYCTTIEGRINFGKTLGWSSMDILEKVKAVASDSSKNIMMQFAAAKKDGYLVAIDSRESKYAPYLKVKVNGSYREYPAVSDTYVTAESPSASMGAATKLYAEESVASIEIDTLSDRDGVEIRQDPYRKVPVLAFQLSDLKSSDKITEARLYLHGQMQQASSPGGIRLESNEKSLFAITYNTTAMLDEASMNYQTWMGKQSYHTWSGEANPGFLIAPDGREALETIQSVYNYIEHLARGYTATKDERFVWHLLRVYLGMIRENGDYEDMLNRSVNSVDGDGYWHGPFHFAQKATFCGAQYTKRYIQSKTLTPEIWTAILKDHWHTGHYLSKVWLGNEEKGNFGSMAARGLADISMCYPEFKEAQAPLSDSYFRPELPGSRQGGWIATASYRLEQKSMSDLNYDGSSIESSNAYVIQILNDLRTPYTTARQVGADYTAYYTDKMLDQMKKGALFLLDNTTPWLGDWQYGDGDPQTVDYAAKIKPLTDLISDQTLQYFANNRLSGKKPSYTTKVWDTVAKANFRNNWSVNAVAAHLENSNNPSHGHNDDLHLSLAAYGNYLLVDPLEVNYNVSLPAERWLSSTRGHNTVEINNTTAKGARDYRTAGITTSKTSLVDYFGDTIYYPPNSPWESIPDGRPTDPTGNGTGDMHPENRELNDIYDFVRAETFGYENHGAMQDNYQVVRDTLFLKKGYFIVTDYIKPTPKTGTTLKTAENTYKQLWHFLPDANISVDDAGNTIRTNFSDKANLIVATVDDGTITPKEKKGLYGTGKPNFVEADYAYFEKTASGVATFNTVLYPTKAGVNQQVTTKELSLDVSSDQANAFSAEITSGTNVTKVSYYTVLEKAKQARRSFGEYETDGVMALAEAQNGAYTTAVLRDGKFLMDHRNDKYLIYSTKKLSDIGVSWANQEINISYDASEAEIDLSKLTIATTGSVSAVMVNGKSVSYRQKGSYVYFGSEPLLSERSEPFTRLVTTNDSENVISLLNSSMAGLTWKNVSSGAYSIGLSGVQRNSGDYALRLLNPAGTAHHGEQVRIQTEQIFDDSVEEITLSFDLKLEDLNSFRDIRMYYNSSVSAAASLGLWRFYQNNSSVRVADSVVIDSQIQAGEWHTYKITQKKLNSSEYLYTWYLDGVVVHTATISPTVTPNQYLMIVWQDTAASDATMQMDNFRMYRYPYATIEDETVLSYSDEKGWSGGKGTTGSLGKSDTDRFLQFDGNGSVSTSFPELTPNETQDIVISLEMKAQDVYNKRFFKLNNVSFVEWNALNTLSICGPNSTYYSKGENITKLNQWHRYIIRLSKRNNKQYFYVDGTLLDERELLFTTPISNFSVAHYNVNQKTQIDNLEIRLCDPANANDYCTRDTNLLRYYDFSGIGSGTTYHTDLKVLSNVISAESGMFYQGVTEQNADNIVAAGYAKAADDKALRLYSVDSGASILQAGYSMQKMYPNKLFSPANPTIAAGSVVRGGVSLRLTENSRLSDKKVMMTLYPRASNAGIDSGYNTAFEVASVAKESGRLTVCGMETDIYLLSGKWYRFEYEVMVSTGDAGGQNRIFFYLDGKKLTLEPVSIDYNGIAQASVPTASVDFYVSYQANTSNDELYVDDFVFEYLTEGNVTSLSAEKPDSTSRFVSVGANGFITLMDERESKLDITALSQCLSGTYSFRNATAMPITSGLANDTYLVQKRELWPEIFYRISSLRLTEENGVVSAFLPCDGERATLILGIYHGNQLCKLVADADATDGGLKVEEAQSEGNTYRIFLWDSLETMTPYYTTQ